MLARQGPDDSIARFLMSLVQHTITIEPDFERYRQAKRPDKQHPTRKRGEIGGLKRRELTIARFEQALAAVVGLRIGGVVCRLPAVTGHSVAWAPSAFQRCGAWTCQKHGPAKAMAGQKHFIWGADVIDRRQAGAGELPLNSRRRLLRLQLTEGQSTKMKQPSLEASRGLVASEGRGNEALITKVEGVKPTKPGGTEFVLG